MNARGGGGQEAWRWKATSLYTPVRTIGVIEPPKDEEADRPPATVPFGFARVIAPERERVECEPLLWEGDGA